MSDGFRAQPRLTAPSEAAATIPGGDRNPHGFETTHANNGRGLVGYARCSTAGQDLTAQRQALRTLGVPDDRIYLDHGLTGRNRNRPGLAQALAAVCKGDTLVVPKFDRLARSVPDARAIADELEQRDVRLQLGTTVYDANDPMGRMFFNVLATFAEFEADLLSLRTREGMLVAKAKGRLKGKPPKLSGTQQMHLIKLLEAGEHTIPELAELFSVSRATVYRVIQRAARRDRRLRIYRTGRSSAWPSWTSSDVPWNLCSRVCSN